MNESKHWQDRLKERLAEQTEIWEKPEQYERLANDLITDISQLLKEQTQWISVKDKLPKEKQSIIFYINEKEFVFDERISTGIYLNGQFYDDDFNDWGLRTTHWMPLPTEPQTKGEVK
jgi:hypothetical protein